jgi:hypothetical protein
MNLTKTYREMTPLERRELDCFYGGFASALTAALYMESGTDTPYREAMGTIDVHEFYLWARRNQDRELIRIRQYLRGEAYREKCAAFQRSKRGEA